MGQFLDMKNQFKSPFPGMDPYLELHWPDVHHRLCTYACDAIQPQVLPHMRARLEERLIVEDPNYIDDDIEVRTIFPDVKVTEKFPSARRSTARALGVRSAAESTVAMLEPEIIRVASEKQTEAYIQIVDPSTGGKLITVVEFLSPSNKTRGEGGKQYRAKQAELAKAGVSLVEIDLVRSGGWNIQVPPSRIKASSRTHYKACAHRGWKDSEFEYYAMPISLRLRKIRIPLRKNDDDAILDLQELIEKVYTNGAYSDIDYARALPGRISSGVEADIASILKKT